MFFIPWTTQVPLTDISLPLTDFELGEITPGEREPIPNCPLSVSRYWPSLKKDSFQITKSVSSLPRSAPVAASQSLTVLSFDADATSCPSGENATALTPFEWPLSVRSDCPVAASQSSTVPSSDA